MGFFKTLFRSTENSLQNPHDLKILAEEMKEHAMILFKEGKEPSIVEIKLYNGQIAIQCEYQRVHRLQSKPEYLNVYISFPHDKLTEQDINLIIIAFFGHMEHIRKWFKKSESIDFIGLKRIL